MPTSASASGVRSLLWNARHADVVAEPFPHIVVRDALDDALCLELLQEFPSIATVTGKNDFQSNERFSYSAGDSLQNEQVSASWRALVQEHVSQEFLQQFISLFAPHIRAEYSGFENRVGALEMLRAGVRKRDTFEAADVLLDAQICVNTPVVGEPSSVRGAHFDMPDKLFAGLFYLRHPDDDSTGGDLELSVFKNDKPANFQGQFIEEKYVRAVKTVRYERNVLVLFLNSPRALHGVTLRSVTSTPRYFMNLVGEVREPLFDVAAVQKKSALGKLRGLVAARS